MAEIQFSSSSQCHELVDEPLVMKNCKVLDPLRINLTSDALQMIPEACWLDRELPPLLAPREGASISRLFSDSVFRQRNIA